MAAFTHLRVLLMSLLIIQTVGSPIVFKSMANQPSSDQQGVSGPVLGNDVDQLSDDKQSIKNNEKKGLSKGTTPHLAFSAYLTHSYNNLKPGSTIVFDALNLNDGEMYNPFTGMVTIPIDGVYSFSVFIVDRSPTHLGVVLTLNGNVIAEARAESDKIAFDDQGGNLAIFKASKGQIVKIEYAGGNGSLYGDPKYKVATFSGELLYVY